MELPKATPVREVEADQGFDLEAVSASLEPVILRGAVSDWPVVKAAKTSDTAMHDYLSVFDRGAKVPVSVGSPANKGRVFYTEDFTGFNVERGTSSMTELLQRVKNHGGAEHPPLIYLASADVDECLPGFREQNDLDFGQYRPVISIWIGTRTRIAAHNDLPLNIACVAAGQRRFTLFPPDQIENLYVGPFETTPAGRPISLVDFANPDLDQYPRFTEAMAHARIADLEPGDAIFIPSMWWHHVEALGTFNILMNYWWRTVPAFLGTPQDVLNHAMMTLRDMPQDEKEIWRQLFDYYVFGESSAPRDHVPENIRGILSPVTEESARQVRAFLLNRLNR
ncbi:cupin-like domain-containing protein [Parvularcula marina]|uniref:Cupin-like domain-containing protein n=1 Tax=Parvularcula marina TaxID=2292771 RepID=A0A371RHK4_9PROT|nr:cupin-like domain-containing protein [Parvularcula marina]RFB04929.1 cupin-like domain-containing protein [Parvularcula marina]